MVAVGIEADDGSIDKLLNEMKGREVEEVIARGREKLAAVPSGGAVGTAVCSVCVIRFMKHAQCSACPNC